MAQAPIRHLSLNAIAGWRLDAEPRHIERRQEQQCQYCTAGQCHPSWHVHWSPENLTRDRDERQRCSSRQHDREYRKYKIPFSLKNQPAHPEATQTFRGHVSSISADAVAQPATRPDFNPVIRLNQTASRAPPLPGVIGNVLLFYERIFLSRMWSFVAGRGSRVTESRPGIRPFPSGARVSS